MPAKQSAPTKNPPTPPTTPIGEQYHVFVKINASSSRGSIRLLPGFTVVAHSADEAASIALKMAGSYREHGEVAGVGSIYMRVR